MVQGRKFQKWRSGGRFMPTNVHRSHNLLWLFLFSATPRIISKVRDDHQAADNKRRLPLVPLNDLEPVTNIQIWLADGERIIQKFNVSHR